MSELLLNVETRKEVGKKSTKQLRRDGKVPGVYYIHGEESIALTLDEKKLRDAIYSDANVIDLQFDSGKKAQCVIRDIQWHPVYDNPIHVDLLGIKLGEKITVDIPVRLTGESVGAKQEGGVLQHIIREISIECLPKNIPEYFELDITNLKIGDSIRVEDIAMDNMTLLTDPSQSIVTVRPPTIIKEETAEEGIEEGAEEAATEPEVVGQKEDTEGESE